MSAVSAGGPAPSGGSGSPGALLGPLPLPWWLLVPRDLSCEPAPSDPPLRLAAAFPQALVGPPVIRGPSGLWCWALEVGLGCQSLWLRDTVGQFWSLSCLEPTLGHHGNHAGFNSSDSGVVVIVRLPVLTQVTADMLFAASVHTHPCEPRPSSGTGGRDNPSALPCYFPALHSTSTSKVDMYWSHRRMMCGIPGSMVLHHRTGHGRSAISRVDLGGNSGAF